MKLKATCGHTAVIALLLVASWNPAGARGGTQKSFDGFVEQLAAQWMRADPVSASAQQYFTGAQQSALDRQLTAKDFAYGIPLGRARRVEYVQRARRALEQLKGYPRAQLTPSERASGSQSRRPPFRV
jgi:hypothetical protein